MAEEKVHAGRYEFWAQVSDKDSGMSAPSEKVAVTVGKPVWLMVAGSEVGGWWAALLVLIILSIHAVVVWRTKRRSARDGARSV
jgi:hypothetical protein